jgi:hypothetical protein
LPCHLINVYLGAGSKKDPKCKYFSLSKCLLFTYETGDEDVPKVVLSLAEELGAQGEVSTLEVRPQEGRAGAGAILFVMFPRIVWNASMIL